MSPNIHTSNTTQKVSEETSASVKRRHIEEKLEQLRSIKIISSRAGNLERRKEIAFWDVETVIGVHNILIWEIIHNQHIDTSDEQILLSLAEEGIESSGTFYGQIQSTPGSTSISHESGVVTLYQWLRSSQN